MILIHGMFDFGEHMNNRSASLLFNWIYHFIGNTLRNTLVMIYDTLIIVNLHFTQLQTVGSIDTIFFSIINVIMTRGYRQLYCSYVQKLNVHEWF